MKRRDFTSLLKLSTLGFAMTSMKQLSNWSSHLQYSLGLSYAADEIEFFNDAILAGSLSMTSLRIG
jgi:hypothetical protein